MRTKKNLIHEHIRKYEVEGGEGRRSSRYERNIEAQFIFLLFDDCFCLSNQSLFISVESKTSQPQSLSIFQELKKFARTQRLLTL